MPHLGVVPSHHVKGSVDYPEMLGYQFEKVRMVVLNLHEKGRHIETFKQLAQRAKGLIFLLPCDDSNGYDDARLALRDIVTGEELLNKHLLVLKNCSHPPCDQPPATQVADNLSLGDHAGLSYKIFPTSGPTGLLEALFWLTAKFIDE